jgi:hypothetical protein
MLKKIICIALALALIGAAGCSLGSKPNATSTTPAASVDTVREATISKIWTVKQLQINLASDVSLILKLKDGDLVDSYFYVIKGDNIGFSISGSSLIYTSQSTDSGTNRVNSDRVSFTASQAQGLAYTMTLTPSSSSSAKDTTVFLEIIYPVTGSLFVQYGTK